MSYELKAPGDVLDYPVGWTLETNDAIAASAWAIAPVETGGLAVVGGSPAVTGATASCLLTGGVPGHVYSVTNTVQTSAGRTMARDRVFRIGAVGAV